MLNAYNLFSGRKLFKLYDMLKEILVVALLRGGYYVGDDNNVCGITQSLKDKGFNNVQYEVSNPKISRW